MQTVAAQNFGRVGRGRYNQICQIVTKAEPAAKQRRQYIRADKGMPEIQLGRVTVPNDFFAPCPGAQGCQDGAGQNGVDMYGIGAGLPAGNHLHPGALQGGALVVGCLPDAAFIDKAQGTRINMYPHSYLQSPKMFCATAVKPMLYRAMEAGLHSRMMAVYSCQRIEVVPAKKQR